MLTKSAKVNYEQKARKFQHLEIIDISLVVTASVTPITAGIGGKDRKKLVIGKW